MRIEGLHQQGVVRERCLRACLSFGQENKQGQENKGKKRSTWREQGQENKGERQRAREQGQKLNRGPLLRPGEEEEQGEEAETVLYDLE